MSRFINADGYIQTGQSLLDKNMFAYCLNNPVNMLDKNGDIAGWIVALIVISVFTIAGGIIGGMRKTSAYKQAYSNSQNNNSNSQNNKPANCNKGKSNNSNNKKSPNQKTRTIQRHKTAVKVHMNMKKN